MDLHVPLAATERATPLRMPRALTEELSVSLSLPEGTKVLALPKEADLVGLPASLRARVTAEGRVLSVDRRLSIEQTVDPKDYPSLRAILIEWTAPDARRLVLQTSEATS
jgi:hypothetical protein